MNASSPSMIPQPIQLIHPSLRGFAGMQMACLPNSTANSYRVVPLPNSIANVLSPLQRDSAYIQNLLMTRFPHNNIEEVDNDARGRVNYSIVSFLNSQTGEVQQQFSNLQKDNLIVGSAIGCPTGFVIGMAAGAIPFGIIAGPPGLILGGLFGSIIGFFSGFVAAFSVCKMKSQIEIKSSSQYKAWLNAQVHSSMYIPYVEYLRARFPDSNIFFCMIKSDYPEMPVRSPNGHVYDLACISEWLDRKWAYIETRVNELHDSTATKQQRDATRAELAQHTVCPMRGAPFHKKDLVYDTAFSLALRNHLKELLEEDGDLNPHIRAGFQALIGSLNSSRTMVMAQKINELNRHMAEQNLPENEKVRLLNRLLQNS